MEILVLLAVLSLVIALTLSVVLLKLFFAILVIPFKLLGSVLGNSGVSGLFATGVKVAFLPVKILLFFGLFLGVLVGLTLVPISVIVVVAGGLLLALSC